MLNISISGPAFLCWAAGMGLGMVLLIWVIRAYITRRANQHSRVLAPLRGKYPWADVFRWRPAFLNVGLILSLGLAVLALAWTRYERTNLHYTIGDLDEDILEIDIPRTDVPPPLPPPPTAPPRVEVVADETPLEETPEFLDLSIDSETPVEAPKAVTREPAPAPLPPPPKQEASPDEEEIFRVVEEMPLFPGCSELPNKEARKQCSDQKLLSFLANNLKYPALAREVGMEGTVFITFVVEKDGRITDARILREPGAALGQEALRVVNLMNEQEIRWTPGRQIGRPVRVQFSLPVRFKLQ